MVLNSLSQKVLAATTVALGLAACSTELQPAAGVQNQRSGAAAVQASSDHPRSAVGADQTAEAVAAANVAATVLVPTKSQGSTQSAGVALPTPTPAADSGLTPTPTPFGSLLVPVFVATGKMQRTLFSCDGGQSWLADTNVDPTAVCFINNGPDCDHNAYSDSGLQLTADGYAIATFGHGAGGSFMKSADGVTWTPLSKVQEVEGLAYGNGVLLAAINPATIASADDGVTWNPTAGTGQTLAYTRDAGFLGGPTGRFYYVGQEGSGQQGGRYSDDGGATWTASTQNGCLNGTLIVGNTATFMVGYDGTVCMTTDFGATWNSASPPSGSIVWADDHFLSLSTNVAYTSTNGVNWAQQPSSGAGAFDKLTYNPGTHTYVGLGQGWASWYANQHFYFSRDGLNWRQLTAAQATGGHPIDHLRAGFLHNSSLCPGP